MHIIQREKLLPLLLSLRMDPTIYLGFLAFLPLLFFLTRSSSKRLPPGSFGIPLIGHTFQILNCMRTNTIEEWLGGRARKYGPVSKLNFLGNPTVFLYGQAANKFVYTADYDTLSAHQPTSLSTLLGDRNILDLAGQDHKRLRGAIASFLNPDALRRYVDQMDEEIKLHLKKHWYGKKEILVMPLMKTLTFDVISTLIFGIERGPRRDELLRLFNIVLAGALSFPVNLPYTRFNKSLRAVARARDIIKQLMREKREKIAKNDVPEHPDLITRMLILRDKNNKPLVSDKEIIDNCIVLMIAGHDTTSILLSFLIKNLVENPHVYKNVLKEQEEIARTKAPGERLTWDDLNKMKYTWRAATETLRMITPVTITFRKAMKDIEWGGYLIPKGWTVSWAAFMTHMDDSIYPDPYKFDPTRYEKQGATPPHTYIAFGAGARLCPGNEFARIEALTMIHYLVNEFEWKLSLKENVVCRDPMPAFKKGLPIKLEVKKPQA